MPDDEGTSMADGDSRSPAAAGRPGRAVRWWLAAATFVVGLFAGGIVVGLLSGGSTTPVAGAATGRSASPGPSTAAALPSSPAAGGTAQVVVNDACLRALNAAQDIYATVDDLAEAARELNAARLDEAIRQLEPLQGRLRENIGNCQVVTRLPNGSVVTSTPTLSSGAAPSS